MKNHLTKLFMFIFILAGLLFADEDPVNIIQNSSFDDSLNTWNFYTADDNVATIELDTDSVITGKNCAHVNVLKSYKDYPSGKIMLNTPVSIYKGTKYHISFKIRANKDITGKGVWWCLYDDPNDENSFPDGMYGQVLFDKDTTITFEQDFIASMTDETCNFSIDFAAIPVDSVELWIDDVQLSVEQVTPGVTPEGAGTTEDPYKITSLGNLSWMTQAIGIWWNKHYVQMNDIDASDTQYWDSSDDNQDGDAFNDPNDFTSDGDNDGWRPIGGEFRDCSYDGGGNVIDGLTINSEGTYVGMFYKVVFSRLENIGLTNVDITAKEAVGALVGAFQGDTVENCYSTGKVVATGQRAGGLIAYMYGSDVSPYVINSHSDADVVAGGNYVGGFIGNIKGVLTARIENCYATGSVKAINSVGGFVGKVEYSNKSADSTIVIDGCYATGDVTGGGYWYDKDGELKYSTGYVAGFVGYLKDKNANQDHVRIENSYSSGDVYQAGETIEKTDCLGGFVGYNYSKSYIANSYSLGSVVYADTAMSNRGFSGKTKGTITACFFDSIASNQSSAYQADAKTTAEMMQDTTFANAGWDLTNVWNVDHNYPDLVNNSNDDLAPLLTVDATKPEGSGTESDPFKIATLGNLSWLTQNDSIAKAHNYFVQTEDIDASATVYWDDSDDNGDGDKFNDFNDLVDAGNNDGWLPIKVFSGSYDGAEHEISELNIVNRLSFMGFGFITTIDSASIKDLSLSNAVINGNSRGAVLAGIVKNGCTIDNVHTSGEVFQTGAGEKISGFVAWLESGHIVITNCSSDVDITADSTCQYIAGFTAYIDAADTLSIIKRCSNKGDVKFGYYTVGGFVAKSQVPNLPIVECYNEGNVTGLLDSKGKNAVGGFAGQNKVGAIIRNCYNIGDVTIIHDNVGREQFGNFCGYNLGILENCYTVGKVFTPNMDTVVVTKGFVGKIQGKYNKGTVTNCIYDTTVSNMKFDTTAMAKTTAEMKSEATYTDAGWDFTSVWEIVDNNYPTFKEVAVAINEEKSAEVIPSKFELRQNYPNPFNPTTTIRFALPAKSDVTLTVYNIVGQKVAELVNAKMNAGNHTVNFKAGNLASGVYIYRIKAGKFVSVKKMMLIK